MSLPRTFPIFTPEDYLALERASEIRHEYLDGFVYAMAGESPEHSTIRFNLAGIVHAQLKDKPCRGFSPNMRVRTGSSGLFAYPDLMVVCGEPVFHDKHRDVLVNPTVIFEVLSPFTEGYDRSEKFLRYTAQTASLKDYVLVYQNKPRVEHYSRQPDDTWPCTEVERLTSVLYLPSIDCQLPLAEIYDRIALA
ncbi:MAG TPA: Uma2 family endonuclease [Blastocatellia bacterium]|nr:Uma2 family endonuclease [Blastocatellia bacterium]